MTQARIYQPAINAMQSGTAGSSRWVVEFEPESPKWLDGLTGWTGSADTRQQVRLKFASREEAEAYARRNRLEYRIEEPKPRRMAYKNYADKFAWKK